MTYGRRARLNTPNKFNYTLCWLGFDLLDYDLRAGDNLQAIFGGRYLVAGILWCWNAAEKFGTHYTAELACYNIVVSAEDL